MRRALCNLMIAAYAVAGVASAAPAVADDRRWWHDDIHHFHEHDLAIWHRGSWFHGVHGGRAGWWWIVGGTWYFYPAPVYPYPDPYVPPVVAAPAGPSNYYYCPNPAGYYPQIPSCSVPWQAVPAGAPTPPPPPTDAAPPPPPPPAANNQTCREYNGSVTIEGQQQQAHGTACLQPDGTWKIIN